MKKVICSEKAPGAIGPYSQAIEANGMVFVSGQLPIDAATGKMAEFLNTSVNTVYTYRTKMRYDSIDGPDKFEENIKNIDCFKI